MSGTIAEIGDDIKRIKNMRIDHIIFGYNFLPTGREVDNMNDVTKQLSNFAR